MITRYFTEQEKEYWEKDEFNDLVLSFTERFLSFCISKKSEFSLDVDIYNNPIEFNRAVDYFKYGKMNQFSDYNLILKEKKLVLFCNFLENSINDIIENNKNLNLDIKKIFIAKKGKIITLRKPVLETKNNNNEYHNINGEAILWPDESKEYIINGIEISSQLFQKLNAKQYSFKDFVNEPNEEIKSAAMQFYEEKYGNEYVFNFLREHLHEVDTYVNKKDEKYLKGTTQGMNVGVYTLYKGSISGFAELAFVRCYCPSTDRMFFLGVHPNETNAKDAIASLYRIPRTLVNEIKYIQRQGERFSTVFTDRGNELLKKINETNFQDLTSISGDEYFNKMYYEF